MRPIPKSMLIHSVEIFEEKAGDWGPSDLQSLGMLEPVRIEPSSRVVRDKNNMEVQLAATLFFDCKNSAGNTDDLKEDRIIDFQGDRYRIISVEPLYGRQKLHHYEIGMVRYAGKGQH